MAAPVSAQRSRVGDGIDIETGFFFSDFIGVRIGADTPSRIRAHPCAGIAAEP